jgi:hypothetical protein
VQAAAISGAGLGAFLRLIPFILCSHADFPQRSTKFVSDFQPPILAGPQLPIDVFDRLSRDFRCFGPSSVLIWEFFAVLVEMLFRAVQNVEKISWQLSSP